MQIYHQIQPVISHNNQKGCAIALGYFDGIHIGHRSVIQMAIDWANANQSAAALFTFALPQKNTLKGNRLFTLEDKHQLVQAMGVEHYFAPDFVQIKDQTPEQFVANLIKTLGARAIVCGENFTFGAKAAGNVSLLKKLCAQSGVEVFALPMAQYDGQPVSSTRIRAALSGGDITAVNAMLGMPYAIHFEVQHGQGLGKKLGVPTINQNYPEGFQLPKEGIYITRVLLDGKWYPSATGIGSRPTVNQDTSNITCETFIAGFEGDLYGKTPVLEFHSYLSPTQRFDSLDALKNCIDQAANAAVAYFSV